MSDSVPTEPQVHTPAERTATPPPPPPPDAPARASGSPSGLGRSSDGGRGDNWDLVLKEGAGHAGRWLLGLWGTVRRKIAWKVVLVLVASLGLWLKFVALPWAASGALTTFADAYGMDVTVESWTGDLSDLSATAHDLVVRVPGPYKQSELLTVDEVELDLSLAGRVLRDRWVREIRLKDPKLYMERLLSGRWNWSEMGTLDGFSSGTEKERRVADFVLQRIAIEGMSLAWVENLPGGSGDGIIQERTASLYLDDIEISMDDVRGLLDPRPRASRVMIEARTGDGRISFDGRGNLFQWGDAPAPEAKEGVAFASTGRSGATTAEWVPSVGATLYLENVGSGALARLTPEAALLPKGGSLTGKVEIDLADHRLDCSGELRMQGVAFAVNGASGGIADRAGLETSLASYRAQGLRTFDCGGDLRDETFRPVQGFQTRVVRSAVQDAPNIVRAAAEVDNARYTGDEIDPELARWVQRLLDRIPPEIRDLLNLPGARREGRSFRNRVRGIFGRG